MTRYDMRYAERGIGEDETNGILDSGEYCVVSTVDADGSPYGVPLSFVRSGRSLYVHATNDRGHKLDDFVRDDRVCVTVVRNVAPCFENGYFSTRYESAMAFGRIVRVTDDEEIRRALAELCMKYVPEAKHEIGAAIERGMPGVSVWRVDIEELTGKAGRTIG